MLVANFKNHTMQEGQKFEGKNNQCTGTIIKETCVGAFIRETQVPIAQKLYDSQRICAYFHMFPEKYQDYKNGYVKPKYSTIILQKSNSYI